MIEPRSILRQRIRAHIPCALCRITHKSLPIMVRAIHAGTHSGADSGADVVSAAKTKSSTAKGAHGSAHEPRQAGDAHDGHDCGVCCTMVDL